MWGRAASWLKGGARTAGRSSGARAGAGVIDLRPNRATQAALPRGTSRAPRAGSGGGVTFGGRVNRGRSSGGRGTPPPRSSGGSTALVRRPSTALDIPNRPSSGGGSWWSRRTRNEKIGMGAAAAGGLYMTNRNSGKNRVTPTSSARGGLQPRSSGGSMY